MVAIITLHSGLCVIYNPASRVCVGECGIHNDLAVGYNVYVGVNTLPDLSVPTLFTNTLPASIPYASPGMGSDTYQVLIREVDSFGLESRNQKSLTVKVDSAGTQLLTPITPPTNLTLYEQKGGGVRILATYPGYGRDTEPATLWKVWAGISPPSTVDAPVITAKVSSISFATTLGSYTPGIVHFLVALYRARDDSLSATLTGTITISQAPEEVEAVPSGFQAEE